ncbi:MAG: carbohydrate deacetylase [Anaerolineae bacterium]|nr:carbohydrate deacetylase [Anaerolineae bacterium]
MIRKLIVNADDLGLSPGVNQGILEAHLRGILTSTTAMVNMPDAGAGIELLQREAPQVGIGLHLNLTTGRPVLPPDQVPSLVQEGVFPYHAGNPLARADRLDPDEVSAELRAQFERFLQLAGRKPDHLDSHHHAAYHIPAAFLTLLELAGEYHLPVRAAADWRTDETLTGPRYEALRQILAQAVTPRWTDHFETRFYAEGVTLDNLLALLDGLPEGVTELMCHPGYNDGFRQNYAAQREVELVWLTDPAVRSRIIEQEIQLISFVDLADS